MKTSTAHFLRHGVAFLVCVTSVSIHAASLVITPSAITNTYAGNLTVQVTDLSLNQTVIVEKYIDLDADGSVDSGEPLVRQFRLTDGGASVIGGVTNLNLPFDTDGAVNGAASTVQRFDRLSEVERLIVRYVYRVTDTLGAALATAVLQVNPGTFPQALTGSVSHASTNVPFATVFALTADDDGEFYAGTIADASGNYSLPIPVGNYIVIASRPGYVGSFADAPSASLSAGINSTANVPLRLADRVLAGKIANASQPAEGIPGVQMFVGSADDLYLLAVTDQTGNFNLPVTASVWSLEINDRSLASLGFVGPGNTDPSFLTTTGSVLAANVLLNPATALIYGRILDTNGVPVTNATLEANASNNGGSTSSRPNSQGYYALGVTAGSWFINFDGIGLPGQFIDGTNITVAAGQAFLANFATKSFTAYIDGRVLDGQTGSPLASRSVTVSDQQNTSQYVTTDGTGHFRVGVTGGKTWYVQLESSQAAQNNEVGSSIGYPVTDGLDVSNAVVWVRAATGFIQGTVKDSQNNALVNFNPFANITFNGTNYNSGADVQPDGSYQIPVFNGVWSVGVGGNFNGLALATPANQSATVANNTPIVNFVISPIQRALLGPLSRSALGQIQFTVTGSPNVTYRVETSTNLTAGAWTLVGTVTISSPFETIIDNRPVAETRRFYRVIWQLGN
ncbi:MAG: hypothetical protein H7X97_08380 [Opitutaceae bacterium]|nr:hypothetical protein [Verrucomicrobiales bacterium]